MNSTSPDRSSPSQITSSVPFELMTTFGRTKGQLLTQQTADDAVAGSAEIGRDVIYSSDGACLSTSYARGNRRSVGSIAAVIADRQDGAAGTPDTCWS